ncbi:hypothetical protein, partial [Enterobacter hormaechei]
GKRSATGRFLGGRLPRTRPKLFFYTHAKTTLKPNKKTQQPVKKNPCVEPPPPGCFFLSFTKNLPHHTQQPIVEYVLLV